MKAKYQDNRHGSGLNVVPDVQAQLRPRAGQEDDRIMSLDRLCRMPVAAGCQSPQSHTVLEMRLTGSAGKTRETGRPQFAPGAT